MIEIDREALDALLDKVQDNPHADYIPGLVEAIDKLRKAERFAVTLERQARHHARRCDAEVAEADARVKRLEADLAHAEARWTRHQVECEDARPQRH